MNWKTTWAKLQMRKKLIDAFRSGEIYLKYETSDENERHIFPTIRAIDIDKTSKSITFTLPNGLDPKLLKKNFYVFQQHFGQKVHLEGDIKRFTLSIKTNNKKEIVPYMFEELAEIIEKEGYFLPIVCGKDRNGAMRIYDALLNPNLLISGEPGSGKSSILHTIICTLIQYYPPDKLQLILADFKQNELCIYEEVEHVKDGKVCYNAQDLKPYLTYLMSELKIRGELLRKHRVRHMKKVPSEERRPSIVFVVDEFVMIRDKEIMAEILQIASLGRAYAMYVILSMQRPSHKILDSDIRGVISVRMSFKTVDLRNAMMVETPGSEKISKDEPGTFILNLDGLTELRAPYLDEDGVENILEPYKTIKGGNAKTAPAMHFEKELETTEIFDNVFGVLDE